MCLFNVCNFYFKLQIDILLPDVVHRVARGVSAVANAACHVQDEVHRAVKVHVVDAAIADEEA